MKTEKRLTMALSVLVALMMLAVPLASSSNLFVDGGQTNSNGDAPTLGADAVKASYDITFKLNADNKSLDAPEYNLPSADTTKKITAWYKDENGDIHAIVEKNAKLGDVISALYSTSGSIVTKDGYDLDVWKNEATGATYNDKSKSDETPVTSDMTFSAVWLLKDTHCEISVIVEYKGETTEYVKAYEYAENSNQKKITVPEKGLLTDGISDIDTFGIVVNYKDADAIKPYIEKVYSFKATYGDNKEFEFGANANVTIPVDSKISIKYTFDSENYSEITVKSIAFKDGQDVTLYASKLRAYTYAQVYAALTVETLTEPAAGTGYVSGSISLPILDVSDKTKNVTKDGYKLTGWNEGAELLKSENNASSPLTLDAELNGYYVIFMSKGQFEYVYVPFGELSADKTTLDIAGVHHWMWMKYSDYEGGSFVAYAAEESKITILPFNFASTNDKASVEGEANGKTPAAVLIACFTPSTSTSYAVFDASSYTYSLNEDTTDFASDSPTDGPEGTFGNEYVQYVIIPGKVGNSIPTPADTPVYGEESKVLFISWNHIPVKGNIEDGILVIPSYSNKDKFGAANTVTSYYANAVEYNYTITFYDGDKVVGTFYYNDAVPTTDITYGLVAFEYDNKAYEAVFGEGDKLSLSEDAQKAYDSILTPEKDGYLIKQWDDANKNKLIEFKRTSGVITGTDVDIKDMKDDLNLYAQFEAKNYKITYNNTFGDKMTQEGLSVDANVTLYGEVFLNDGFKLIGWSTSAGAAQPEYKLEGSFTLSGADYEDLVKKTGSANVNMYPVWEKLGSGSGTGGNTGGDNDNTALYLIAGMLAVIAILAIVGILLMRRK